jgi:U32 family peptidase
MELLSPAGDLETAVAAFEYGADAVYLGMTQFSARADAVNFSLDDLEVLLGYAHGLARSRKVYVALNTLLREEELPQLYALLLELEARQPDALIVQDFALAQVVHEHFPSLRLHASTQMAIHNVAGMTKCRELGFERVIAARELTLNELSAMAAVPGIELEAFVHGALCYAYSGLCLLSSVLNGHSGNRGDCSYVCRNCWKVEKGGRVVSDACNVMSMKDLALSDSVNALKRAGVASVKIEGRKKTPLYVAAVTNYYRKLLDGTFVAGEREQCEQDLRVIFSRPWSKFCLNAEKSAALTDTATTGPRGTKIGEVIAVTHGHGGDALRFQLQGMALECHDGLQVELAGRERPFGFAVESLRVYQQGGNERGARVFTAPRGATVEVPLPADHPVLSAGMPIFCTSSQAVKQRYSWPALRPQLVRQRTRLDYTLVVSASALHCEARAHFAGGALAVTREVKNEMALEPSKREAAVQQQSICAALGKLGDSAYCVGDCIITNPQNLFIPASVLNELRRDITAQMDAAQAEQLTLRKRAIEAAFWTPAVHGAAVTDKPVQVLKLDRHFLLNLFTPADFDAVGEVIFDIGRTPLSDLEDALKYLAGKVGIERLRIALPVIERASRLHQWLEAIKRAGNFGVKQWQITNISQLELLAANGITTANSSVTADWQLFACNHESARYLLETLGMERVTLAPDDTLENTMTLIQHLGSAAEVLLFQDTPLAISAVCANASLNGYCPQKSGCDFTQMRLTDRKGNELLVINDNCQSVYINAHPLERNNSRHAFIRNGARFLRTDFIWRDWSPAAVKAAWEEMR